MRPKTAGRVYGSTVKPAVTIGNSILEAVPEKTQRRKFSNFASQNPSVYSTERIVPKSKDNEHESLHNTAATRSNPGLNVPFISRTPQTNDIETQSNDLNGKKDCFGFAIKEGSKRLYYCNKHQKNYIKTTILSTTRSTNKVNGHAKTNVKYDETPGEPTLDFTEKIPIIGKTNRNDHSIKTEKLLYESNFPDIKLHRYLPNIPKITGDVYKIAKNPSTLSHNTFDENNDKIDSGLADSDETSESEISKSNENSRDDKIDSGLEEGSRDDFGVFLLTPSTGAPHFFTWSESESREEASVGRHNRHKHKSRHNDRKESESKRGKKNYNAKRKQKTTVGRKADETTSVAYGNDYSAEQSSTAFSRNDPRYDKADDNPSAGTNDRNDWYPPDEITTKSFKMEFSSVDESGTEYPTKGSESQEGLQSTETTNADLPKKNSKKCKERVATTTVGSWRLWFSGNDKNADDEGSTDCEEEEEEDATSFPITSGSEEHKSAAGYYTTDYSLAHGQNKRKGATKKSNSNGRNDKKDNRRFKKLEKEADAYSDVESEEEEDATNCDEHQQACDNMCIEMEQVCDGVQDCQDGSDEADCAYISVRPNFPPDNSTSAPIDGCADHEFPCDGICINRSNICDGESDCADGTDEEGCDRSKSVSESTEGIPLKIISRDLMSPYCKKILA